MKKFAAVLSVWILLFATSVFAQSFGQWKNYTSLLNAIGLTLASDDVVWTATTGGLAKYDATRNITQSIQNTDGISSGTITAVKYDATRGGLWLGFADGTVNFYNPTTGQAAYFLDIASVTNFTSKAIRCFLIKGDSVFVGADFGVSLLIVSRSEFKESYISLGNFASGTTAAMGMALYQGYLYVATLNGLARGNLSSLNLIAPDSWQNFTVADGLATNACADVLDFNGGLYVATSAGLSQMTGNQLTTVSGTASLNLLSLDKNSVTLVAASSAALLTLTGGTLTTKSYPNGTMTAARIGTAGKVWLSDNKRSLVLVTDTGFVSKTPNSPTGNSFTALAFDVSGNLWATGSVKQTPSIGFCRYDAIRGWKNFDFSTVPNTTNAFVEAFASPEGDVWLGGWGVGVVHFFSSSSDSSEVFTGTNSPLSAAPGSNLNYIVIPAIREDVNQTLWMTLYDANNRNSLYAFRKSRRITGNPWVQVSAPASALGYNFKKMDIDLQGRQWLGTYRDNGTEPSATGVLVLDTQNNIDNASNFLWTNLTTSSDQGGLPNNEITAFAFDPDGSVWIGTPTGIGVFYDASTVVSGKTIPKCTSVYDLRNEVINSIAIDPVDRKWVGTVNGAWLMTSDGTSVLEHWTTANSPLLSNTVYSVAIEKSTGRVFFGTDKGLSVYATLAAAPNPSLNKIKIFPNPYFVPANQLLAIDGLSQNATVKIITIAGRLVRSLTSLGGRIAQWDGRDDMGNAVASGVYLVSVISQDGKSATVGKVAVIHK
jgi:ligand-binding sensor domain-containing protein